MYYPNIKCRFVRFSENPWYGVVARKRVVVRTSTIMGLAQGFKRYLVDTMPEVVSDTDVCGDLCILDVLCVIHAFRPRDDGGPVFDQLMRRILDAVAPACAPKCTLLVCFDRQDATPAQKSGTQAKRHKPTVVWTAAEVDALMATRELPVGDAWTDLLATRSVRGRMFEEIGVALFESFAAGGIRNATHLVVHNGRPKGGAEMATVGEPRKEAPEGAPNAGEADVAIAQWARYWLASNVGKRVLTLSIDTDLIPIMLIHGGDRSAVCLMHTDQRHRVAVDTAVFARQLCSKYRCACVDDSPRQSHLSSMVNPKGSLTSWAPPRPGPGGRPRAASPSFVSPGEAVRGRPPGPGLGGAQLKGEPPR